MSKSNEPQNVDHGPLTISEIILGALQVYHRRY